VGKVEQIVERKNGGNHIYGLNLRSYRSRIECSTTISSFVVGNLWNRHSESEEIVGFTYMFYQRIARSIQTRPKDSYKGVEIRRGVV